MLVRVLAVVVGLCVCLSVTRRYCIETAALIELIFCVWVSLDLWYAAEMTVDHTFSDRPTPSACVLVLELVSVCRYQQNESIFSFLYLDGNEALSSLRPSLPRDVDAVPLLGVNSHSLAND